MSSLQETMLGVTKLDFGKILTTAKVKIKTHPGEYSKWTNCAYDLLLSCQKPQELHHQGRFIR